MKKSQRKRLTVAGVDLSATVVNNASITTDGVYQPGNIGFMSLVSKITGNVAITYQISFDNITWFTPSTTDGTTLTSVGTIVTGQTSDCWIILRAILAPWIRFVFTSTGSSTITGDAIWQDES